jgi:hypothetical protein
MPYYFHFASNDGQQLFNHELQCQQCRFIKANGEECRNRVCIGLPRCYHHLIAEYDLQIKTSTIPNSGKGLFANQRTAPANAIVFRRNEIICPYNGEITNQDILTERYGDYTAPYAISIDNENAEDAAFVRGIGSVINHHAIAQRRNVKFERIGDRVFIVATKNIHNGHEMFVNYGNNYMFNEPVRSLTNRKRINFG